MSRINNCADVDLDVAFTDPEKFKRQFLETLRSKGKSHIENSDGINTKWNPQKKSEELPIFDFEEE